MNLSEPFIRRPVATTLLTVAITLAGALSYGLLPVSSLPEIDFPTISVGAQLPGASPETMASSVATPLERQFGRIAGVAEMSSSSGLGTTSVTMQFELDRDVDAAARDVLAAINAARGQLPANLPNNPSYRKVNPADSPIMIMTLTSDTLPKARMYDAASTILMQKLSQVPGVGQVFVGGSSRPSVRVRLNPTILNHLGISLEDVRGVIAAANANRPKGQVASDTQIWSISSSDQLFTPEEYENLIVVYRNGAPVRLRDVARVEESVEDIRTYGTSNGVPSVSLIIFRQPGANIIATVDRIFALMPQLEAQIPADIQLRVPIDRTAPIRASLHEVQLTLCLSVALVILVVFLFLRDLRATFIPSIAVPVSLISTFGVMYLCGYSLDNLSLMALTIATGFVVDDAIVVIENISRYLEQGASPLQAALKGAREIGFTVVSISISLVAVFIPILMMGGIIGRLFREFAVTLSVAIAISLLVSLTTTPMLCAVMLKPHHATRRGWLYRVSERFFDWILWWYEWSLSIVLRHQWFTLLVTLGTVAFTAYLYIIVPKGFFPQQDTGRISANLIADQDTSFQTMERLIKQYSQIIMDDPAVVNVSAYAGGSGGGSGGSSNTARMYISLKPLPERKVRADEIIARIRVKAAHIPGASLFMQAIQDLRIGGRASSSQYQYTLRGSSLDELNEWAPRLLKEMRQIPGVVDVNSDQQNRGLQTQLEVDRLTASRLGISFLTIDNTLYDAFGQRQVSTMYKHLDQYHVVMELDKQFADSPESLRHIYVRTPQNAQVPLTDLFRAETRTTSLSVAHSGQFPSVTLSFNLQPGTSLGDIVPKVEEIVSRIGLPQSIHGQFQGTAQAFQDSLRNQLYLILAAIVAVYIVLGMLYESYIHPLTILSTLPSAGVGALLALLICRVELNVMAMIGILLLIGIVKKNAIMMIDFAIEAERVDGLNSRDAIFHACLLRFRPIIMTTLAALLGGLPLALGTGSGSELRRPLGIAIVGGLIFSQMLTLYTTPVVYLYLDRISQWWARSHQSPRPQPHLPGIAPDLLTGHPHPEYLQMKG